MKVFRLKSDSAPANWLTAGSGSARIPDILPVVPPLMANMSSRPQVAYKFGDFLLNPADKQLLRDGKPVALRQKVFDALLLLVESQAHLVEKNDFLKRVWPDSFVGRGSVGALHFALAQGAAGRNARVHVHRDRS